MSKIVPRGAGDERLTQSRAIIDPPRVTHAAASAAARHSRDDAASLTRPESVTHDRRSLSGGASLTHASRQARYRAAHPERHAEQQRAYRARKRGA